ncbi:hypothetical protein MKZ19_15605 [Shouchella clausii]|nr:hypothetical protein [Shouchella clausii]WQG97382.1 hypothetical protein SR921_15380 [Shouchella clausii]
MNQLAKRKARQAYDEFTNVEAMHLYIIPEELPEGPYGAPVGKEEPVVNKTTEWKEGQRTYSAFNYVNKDLHAGLPRKYPNHHPPHDK